MNVEDPFKAVRSGPSRLEAYQAGLREAAPRGQSRPSTMERVVSAYKRDVAPTEAAIGVAKRALQPRRWPDGAPYSSEDYARSQATERATKMRRYQVPGAATSGERVADSVGAVLSQASDPTNIGLIAATRGVPASMAAAAGGLYEGANQYAQDLFARGRVDPGRVMEKAATGAIISGGVDKMLPASSRIDSSAVGLARPAGMEALEGPVDDNVVQNTKVVGQAVGRAPGAVRLAEMADNTKKRLAGVMPEARAGGYGRPLD
jgi:hypothetical protein